VFSRICPCGLYDFSGGKGDNAVPFSSAVKKKEPKKKPEILRRDREKGFLSRLSSFLGTSFSSFSGKKKRSTISRRSFPKAKAARISGRLAAC
jgi:hypothetical protein